MADDKLDWRRLSKAEFEAKELELFGSATERHRAAPKMPDAEYAAMDTAINNYVTNDVYRQQTENDQKILRDIAPEKARQAAERARQAAERAKNGF